MLDEKIGTIIDWSRPQGWVLEPDAKQILALAGIAVTRFTMAREPSEAIDFANKIGYPVVAKIVSPAIVHKSDVDGVAVGIATDDELQSVYDRMAGLEAFRGLLVEEMAVGMELIVGGKVDSQFGPVVLLGLGGTGVEIYKDTALRMAPIKENDVLSMVNCLTAARLLHGYRGRAAIDMQALIRLMTAFSDLLMKLGDEIASVDLNPVLCSSDNCLVADARIMLASSQ